MKISTMKACLVLSLSLFFMNGVSQECLLEYKYGQSVNVTVEKEGYSSDSLVLEVPINSKQLVDNGKLRADGADLRITNADCNELPFYIQDIPNRDKNVLFVKIPGIDADGYELQLYYGLSSQGETKIDGEKVFDFFDDFEDGNVDYDKWEKISVIDKVEEVAGDLRFTGTYGTGGIFKYITTRAGFEGPLSFCFAANSNNSQVYGVADMDDLERVGMRYNSGSVKYDTLDIVAVMKDTLNGGFSDGSKYPFVQVPRYDLNLISMSAFIDAEEKINFTRFQNHSTAHANMDTFKVVHITYKKLRPFFSSFSQAINIQFVGIHKGDRLLPSYVFNEEKILNSTSASNESTDQLNVYPNPVKHILYFELPGKVPESVVLYDLQGKAIRRVQGQSFMKVDDLSTGIYLGWIHYLGNEPIKRLIHIE